MPCRRLRVGGRASAGAADGYHGAMSDQALPGSADVTPAAGDAGAARGHRRLILDCDPGHDDALAITLALARPELDVLGITTVGGNSPVANTTRNALRVLALLGRPDVPVAAGAARPLVREPWVPVEFHGESGLDGADLPEPVSAARPEGALVMASTLLEQAGSPVTLVATGPLTNIALLVRARPDLHSRIERVCLMGGSLSEGNTTASAEYNIWQDPEAAAVVFGAGIPVSMMGLDVTHRALLLGPDVTRLEAVGTPAAAVFADLLRFFAVYHRRRYGWDGSPIHDAVAVAHLAVPGLVTTRLLRVDIETAGALTRGRTVADPERLQRLPANVEAGVDIDRERFVSLLIEAIASFG